MSLAKNDAPTVAASSAGFGDADYLAFQKKVQARTGVRLADYKPDQMRRRIGTLAQKAGHGSFAAYSAALEKSPALLSDFLDKMTINVSELLRNPDRFAELTRAVLPPLLVQRKNAPLSIWSAGCSYGAEAFTLALLLHEMTPTVVHRIKGTDLDAEILAKARRGRFSQADMANIVPERRKIHFSQESDGSFAAAPHLRNQVQFAKHDLLADAYPKAEYDLIACRNVVIYFTDEAKTRIYQNFFDALRPGGVLFVGGTERLPNHRAIGFELAIPFFYRKPAS